MTTTYRRAGFGECVLVDLDSTLADTRPRRHLAPTVDATKTWQDYSMGCAGDTPIGGTIRFLQILDNAGYGIHIVSGRYASARTLTEKWLDTHHVPWHLLRLRDDDDHRTAAELKLAYLTEITEKRFKPVLALDDDPHIATAYERAGVPVLRINPRYHLAPAR